MRNYEYLTPAEIMDVLFDLEGEFRGLKRTLELAFYDHAEEDTVSLARIRELREELQVVRDQLYQAGGLYTVPESERRARAFTRNMSALKRITYEEKMYFDYESNFRCIVELSEDLSATFERFGQSSDGKGIRSYWLLDDEGQAHTKASFLAALRELHIGEWRESYGDNVLICDGINWELRFDYEHGLSSVEISGMFSMPYNYRDWYRLLGLRIPMENQGLEAWD